MTYCHCQVLSGGVSQADSEEEWKVLPPSRSSAEKSAEVSPSATNKDTPVFMAEGRVSVLTEREGKRGRRGEGRRE